MKCDLCKIRLDGMNIGYVKIPSRGNRGIEKICECKKCHSKRLKANKKPTSLWAI